MECCMCSETIDGVSFECGDCNKRICKDCCGEEGYYMHYEWLDVSITCDVCDKYVCDKCVRFCHDCANYEGTGYFCGKCCPEDIKYLDCEYHTWSTCKIKHEYSDGCGKCRANRNYDGKHRI